MSVRALPQATPEELSQAARDADALARRGWEQEAEKALLGLYFRRALPGDGYAYDMITSMYDGIGNRVAADSWQDRKSLTLGDAR